MKTLAENTPIRLTRCGKCKRFKEHTCPRNDLYRKSETMVYPTFAEACNIFEGMEEEKNET